MSYKDNPSNPALPRSRSTLHARMSNPPCSSANLDNMAKHPEPEEVQPSDFTMAVVASYDASWRHFLQATRIDCISNTAHDTSPARKGTRRVFFHLDRDVTVQNCCNAERTYAFAFHNINCLTSSGIWNVSSPA